MTENTEVEHEDVGKLPISKVLYEEYDIELLFANKGTSGTLSILERGTLAYIEWTPFDSYDVNVHMSFDEWGVIAHDASKQVHFNAPPLQIRVSSIDSIEQDVCPKGRPCAIITTERKKLPCIFFPKLDSIYRFVQCLKRYLCFMRHQNTLVVDHSKAALRIAMKELDLGGGTASGQQQTYKKIAYDFQDVYDVTLSGLSKVTNFIKGGLVGKQISRPHEATVSYQQQQQQQTLSSPPRHLSHRPAEGDFEIYDMRKPLEKCAPVSRDTCVTRFVWETHLNLEGRILRVRELQDKIFGGGIEPELRKDVWPFLLNVFPWDSTYEDRLKIIEQKKCQYEILKQQWKSILPCQLKRFSLHRDREALVEKDVLRTDRIQEFYHGPDNPNVNVLYEMLMTYCQYNFDLGYVQGMSDLLSPLHMLFRDEIMSFWTFVGYMNLVEKHFFMDQSRIQEKLSELSSLIYYCDSELFNHLEKEDSSNFFFCFRWLLINFKREFKDTDILHLWEVLWTCPYNTDYTLFIATAILLQERDTIISQKMSFSEILRYINSLSQQLNLVDVLGNAESLFHNIRSQEDIPFNIRNNILHIVDSPMSSLGTSYITPPSEVIPKHETENLPAHVHVITETQATDTVDMTISEDPASLLVNNVDRVEMTISDQDQS